MWLPPGGVKIHQVQVVDVAKHGADQVGWANEIAAMDIPVIVKNAPLHMWPAHEWTPESLASRLPGTLENVKRSSAVNRTFHYCHGGPLTAIPGLTSSYEAKCYASLDMPTEEFMERIREDPEAHPGGFSYAYSSTIDQWPQALVEEVIPEVLMVFPPEWTPEKSNEFRQTVVWLGQKGTVTPLHFDLPHNFYAQLHGAKHWLLLPPNAWERVYPYPALHPGAQLAQVDTLRPDTGRFPNYGLDGMHAFEAVLNAGDVLYVPPLWFHQVTALNTSISVSVWSHAKASSEYEDMMKRQLPILKSWNLPERASALRLLLESLFVNLNLPGGHNAASFVHWTLLDNRYRHMGTDPAENVDTRMRFCVEEALQERILEEAREGFLPFLKETLASLRNILDNGGPLRRDIFLANWIEHSVSAVVGAARVRDFLHDLAYC